MAYSLAWLAEVLRSAGLQVEEEPGWQEAGHGVFIAAKGAMIHHTACTLPGDMPDLGVLEHGRPDLAGPLCNLGLGRSGKWRVIAAGTAWHAGEGMWKGVGQYTVHHRATASTTARSEVVGTTPGNSHFIGIECENDGIGEPWGQPLLQSLHTGVMAMLRRIGANPIMVCGHKEFCYPPGRKIDPSFPVPEFRLALASAMNVPLA